MMRDNSIFAEQFFSRLIVSSETCSRTSFDIFGFLIAVQKKKENEISLLQVLLEKETQRY